MLNSKAARARSAEHCQLMCKGAGSCSYFSFRFPKCFLMGDGALEGREATAGGWISGPAVCNNPIAGAGGENRKKTLGCTLYRVAQFAAVVIQFATRRPLLKSFEQERETFDTSFCDLEAGFPGGKSIKHSCFHLCLRDASIRIERAVNNLPNFGVTNSFFRGDQLPSSCSPYLPIGESCLFHAGFEQRSPHMF